MTAVRPTKPHVREDLTEAARQQLVDLLDGRLDRTTAPDRARILMEVTLLFLRHSDSITPPTLALFDDIFPRLIEGLDTEMLAALSAALAPLDQVPVRTVTLLAQHSDPTVASPVLAAAKSLLLADLASVAHTGSEAHLLAICARPRLDERLSAILISRALQPVIDRLLINPGAHISLEDFCIALPRATADSRGRIALRQPAIILDNAGRPAGRCVTHDISPGGVKLQTEPGAQVADTITVELPSIGQIRLRCRLAWRQIATVGLQFTKPLAEQLTAGMNRH